MKIAIIGCGYIGWDVAALWTKQGFHVTATTRTPEKLTDLAEVAQKGLILKGNNEDEIIPLIANNDLIVITVAADDPEHFESAYLNTAQIFRHLALDMDLPRDLIYLSSTSVYGDHKGLWVDETSELLGHSEQAKILIDAEKTYLSLEELGWNVCALRLAEIYGPGRELEKRLKSFEEHPLPGTGEQYTNMVHKADCAAAVNYALRHNLTGIYNLADDDHPKKKEFYDELAKKLHLPNVVWDPTLSSFHDGNKRVSNHKIKAAGYNLLHPHRVDIVV